MKNRPHDKTAGIAILLAIIIISLADVIFRRSLDKDLVQSSSNFGEPLAVILLAVTILFLTAKGKDRVCYICYGAWIGYFVLDQFFELPGVIVKAYSLIAQSESIISVGNFAAVIRILGMLCIIAIGFILVEYMNDGTIYNRAFNVFSIATVVFILFNIVSSCISGINAGIPELLLESFNGLYRLSMIFLLIFFAYGSAKAQLKKVDFSQ